MGTTVDESLYLSVKPLGTHVSWK